MSLDASTLVDNRRLSYPPTFDRPSGKMEGMLNDLAIGVDHQQEFEPHYKEKLEESGAAGPHVDFGVQVLTTGYWPTYPAFDVHLPPEMTKCTTLFKDYYDER